VYRYLLYGLVTEVPEPLPVLARHRMSRSADVRVTVAYGPVPRHPELPPPAHEFAFGGAHAHAVFHVDPAGRHITLWLSKESLLHSGLALLVHPVMAAVACLHGRTCLHANVIEVAGSAIAIAGASGSGKSTLSAALWLRGGRVIADDVAALTERSGCIAVERGVTGLKVAADAPDRMAANGISTLPVFDDPFSNRDSPKCYIYRPESVEAVREPPPLHAVYILAARRGQLADPVIGHLPASEALPALLRHATGREVIDRTGRGRDFRLLARLAARVPVRTLECPDALNSLDRVCDAVESDLRLGSGLRQRA